MTNRIIPTATLFLSVFIVGCHSNMSPPQPPSEPIKSAKPNDKQFQDPNTGVSLMYPSDWKPVPGTKSTLEISAPANGKGSGTFSFDIPQMPMIAKLGVPIGRVKSGYIDDAKKKISDDTPSDLTLPSIPNVDQQGLKLTGHSDGKVVIEQVDLIVRNNQVYILSVKSDDKNEPFMHSVLETIIKSVRWTK
jgi:hypothetical protein